MMLLPMIFLIVKTMNKTQIVNQVKENNRKMQVMMRDCKEEYHTLLGYLVLNGMSIQEALDTCYEQLIDRKEENKEYFIRRKK